MNLQFIKPLVERVLRDQTTLWSIQGFGMMRTYFGPPANPKRFRLNLWHDVLKVPNVSTVHDHPWDFTSLIVCGAFSNQRYDMADSDSTPGPMTHAYTTIKCGEGGGMTKSPVLGCILVPQGPEVYYPGDVYQHDADEIHETIYSNGCITLNERIGDTQHARVFWPWGTEWVDAEPRAMGNAAATRLIGDVLAEHFNG